MSCRGVGVQYEMHFRSRISLFVYLEYSLGAEWHSRSGARSHSLREIEGCGVAWRDAALGASASRRGSVLILALPAPDPSRCFYCFNFIAFSVIFSLSPLFYFLCLSLVLSFARLSQ